MDELAHLDVVDALAAGHPVDVDPGNREASLSARHDPFLEQRFTKQVLRHKCAQTYLSQSGMGN